MSENNPTTLAVALLLLLVPIGAAALDAPDPLFQSHDMLEITIAAPFTTLMKERPEEEDLPGRLTYVNEAGETVELDIGLRTRGKYRRQRRTCRFAPIRLNFEKSAVKDTVFHKQDKLKLVTHCRDGSDTYEQIAVREYLAYRVLNTLTDYSFRVRPLQIHYVDTDKDNRERVHFGFVIEHRDRLAKRIDQPALEIDRTRVTSLVPDYLNLTSVFQYFIANTDFSPIMGALDDSCCHNANLFGTEGQLLYSIPYDFDMAGFIDAPYATPNPRFNIRNVKQRLYRGRCVNNSHVPASLQAFRDHKAELYELVENFEPLSKGSRREMLGLMNSFYDTIDNPRSVQRQLIDKCI